MSVHLVDVQIFHWICANFDLLLVLDGKSLEILIGLNLELL